MVFVCVTSEHVWLPVEEGVLLVSCLTARTRGVLSPQVLAELKEYATEVDVDFVRKAVRAIGRCAIKVEASS